MRWVMAFAFYIFGCGGAINQCKEDPLILVTQQVCSPLTTMNAHYYITSEQL